MSTRAWWAAVAVAAVSPGCVHHAHGAPVGLVSDSAPAQPIEFAVVPAGTTFRIALAGGLRAAYLMPNQPFAGIVLDKLMTRDGEVVVPAGSTVQGRIVGADVGSAETVRIDFDAIETRRGLAEMHATVYGVQRFRGGVAVGTDSPDTAGYDAIVFPPPAGATGGAIGGGPLGSEPLPRRTIVALPAGAQLTLVLRRPLIMP